MVIVIATGNWILLIIGTEGELDRISATRNRPYTITGLTTRIGRFVIGNSYFLSDLFLHDDYQEKNVFWC
jgi:hypothetical protein